MHSASGKLDLLPKKATAILVSEAGEDRRSGGARILGALGRMRERGLTLIMCDAFAVEQIRPRIKGSDIWKRIDRNQDERYHHFAAGDVRPAEDGGTASTVPKCLPGFQEGLGPSNQAAFTSVFGTGRFPASLSYPSSICTT